MASTIAAISTSLSPGGIGIVRLSGCEAVSIAAKLVRPHDRTKNLTELCGYTGLYGRLHDRDGEFDDAVVFVYRTPKSYTGEDVAEICCHGGEYLLKRTLAAAIFCGAALAEPGEFTKRAFLGGKLSLTEAEGVAELVSATGSQAAAAALGARDGAVFKEITAVRESLVSLSAALAAWLDYPEEEQEETERQALLEGISGSAERLRGLVAAYEQSRILKDGIDTVIVGRPNVGKSTLMNLLCGEEKSIVTELPGTTRDVVEGSLSFCGAQLKLSDTAGIRPTDEPIEAMGVERAYKRAAGAQLVLLLLDSSEGLTPEDRALLERFSEKPTIAVINKTDLGAEILRGDLPSELRAVEISAKTGAGLESLRVEILEAVCLHSLEAGQVFLATERQKIAAEAALQSLEDALSALSLTPDAVSISLDTAIDCLLSLTGERATEAVVNEVFSKFCVGK